MSCRACARRASILGLRVATQFDLLAASTRGLSGGRALRVAATPQRPRRDRRWNRRDHARLLDRRHARPGGEARMKHLRCLRPMITRVQETTRRALPAEEEPMAALPTALGFDYLCRLVSHCVSLDPRARWPRSPRRGYDARGLCRGAAAPVRLRWAQPARVAVCHHGAHVERSAPAPLVPQPLLEGVRDRARRSCHDAVGLGGAVGAQAG